MVNYIPLHMTPLTSGIHTPSTHVLLSTPTSDWFESLHDNTRTVPSWADATPTTLGTSLTRGLMEGKTQRAT